MPKFICPSCNSALSLDDQYVGKRVRCRCGFVFRAGNQPSQPVKVAPPNSHVNLPPKQFEPAPMPPAQPAPVPQANLIDPWQQPHAGYHNPNYVYGIPPKSKVAAGLLGLFLGNWGAHNFYLGHHGIAVTQLCLTLFGIVTACFVVGIFVIAAVSTWTFIESILCFTGSRLDADGRMLV